MPKNEKTERTLSIDVHEDTVRGPNERWKVAKNDWRDPDEVIELQGYGVQLSNGKLVFQEPDLGRHIDILDLFRRAERDGLRVYGFVVLRDEQRHGH